MKVIVKEGEDGLLEVARSVAKERMPWPTASDIANSIEDMLMPILDDLIMKVSADQFADEIVGWVMETEVDLDHCTDDDIILKVTSDYDALYTAGLWDMLRIEIEVMDNADANEQPSGLSSREIVRKRITKALRTLADRVEQHEEDEK
jgi:hypothetical protein